MKKILLIFGTRPEAIKMAPIWMELKNHPDRFDSVVCLTGQHRQMLDQVINFFNIKIDFDLHLMDEDQDIAALSSRTLLPLTEVIKEVRPDLVLIQGDTTTAMIAALAAFYQKVPVGHIEAGLRTCDHYCPFPEEMNRRLISALASYHFAPTVRAEESLLGEGINRDSIFVTGNTIIDALQWTLCQSPSEKTKLLLEKLDLIQFPGYVPFGIQNQALNGRLSILVTAHRRENFGNPIENICHAFKELVKRNKDIQIVYPVHLNPNIQKPVRKILGKEERIFLIEPLDYSSFVHLMNRSWLILTDSGGIQEEAPAMGKPVLVLRQNTERPENIEEGTAKIIGTETQEIIKQTELLIHDDFEYKKMARNSCPYGDGRASKRIAKIISDRLPYK